MDKVKPRHSLQALQIAKINLKHNSIGHFALAFLFCILTSVLFSITGLDERSAAVPLEMFLSLIGVVLLTPIFQPEQNPEVEDITASKYVSGIYVYLIRIAYSLLTLLLLVSVFLFYMQINGTEITLSLWIGTIADAVFLGSLGMLTAALSNNTAIAYMVPMIYYALNFSGGNKLGNFYLFSMMNGSYVPNLRLFVGGICLIILAVLIKLISKKFR